MDTPDNLTHQLKGAATLYVQVEGGTNAPDVLAAVPGVRKVSVADRHERFIGYEIEAEPQRDVRRDVARAVVDSGWGLLELRPTRMSLEEIFLQLTTEEGRDAAPPPTGAVQAESAPAEMPGGAGA